VADETTTLQIVLYDKGCGFGVEGVGVLFDERLREIVDVSGETTV